MPVEKTDTRQLQFSVVRCSLEDTHAIGAYITQAADDGYALARVTTISGGDQRDPITAGLKMTFRKGEA
jgi:hypothetical protein